MIPTYIHPFLWSYNVSKIDLARDKKRIITNVLNLGTVKATEWLFRVYSREDIKKAVVNPFPGEWSKKSLNFWGIVLGVKPGRVDKRIIRKQQRVL